MKKVLLTLVTVALVLTCVFAFVACNNVEVKAPNTEGYGEGNPDPAVVGDKIVKVDAAMAKDGEAMFLNAVKNFELSNYSTAWLVGQVDTTVVGIKVSQMVDALRVRDNGNQYMYNNSWTKDGKFPDIRLMDQYYYNAADGKCYLVDTAKKKNIDLTEDGLVAKKWLNNFDFANKTDFMKYNPNDPSTLNMYDLNKDTITETTEPVLKTTESGAKYYAFDVTCDAQKAFIPYLPVMKHMLDSNVKGAEIKQDGMELTFKVEIWENGLFKVYDVHEAYFMSIAKIINGSISLNSKVMFNYDNTKQPITNYVKDCKFVNVAE